MGYACSYAGIPFDLDTPEILAWVDHNLPLDHLREQVPVPSWPGKNTAGLALPTWPSPFPVRVGELFYPTGASRWGIFHGLASGSRVAAMRRAVLSSTAPLAAATFLLQSDPGNGDVLSAGGISTSLLMLPPRPLAILPGTLSQGEPLYLVTLVDERWQWQYRSVGKVQVGTSSTWSSLLASTATALGISLTFDPISGTYGVPAEDSPLYQNYESAALLLDALAANIGRVVVRNLDGTYQLQTAQAATTQVAANRPAPMVRLAGAGIFDSEADPSLLSPSCALPSAVVVTFPRFTINGSFTEPVRDPRDRWVPAYGDVQPYTVTLAQAGYSQYPGHPGTRFLRDTARAYLTAAGDSTPANNSELLALATQLATDYYGWQLAGIDECYPGIRHWVPEGADDVLWSYRGGAASTRVQRHPWNWGPAEFQHCFTDVGPGSVPSSGGGGPPISPWETHTLTTVVTNNLTVTCGDTQALTTSLSVPVVTGMTACTDGSLTYLRNDSNKLILITNQDARSLAANRFITPNGQTFTLRGGASVPAIWRGDAINRWELMTDTCQCLWPPDQTFRGSDSIDDPPSDAWSSDNSGTGYTVPKDHLFFVYLAVRFSGTPGTAALSVVWSGLPGLHYVLASSFTGQQSTGPAIGLQVYAGYGDGSTGNLDVLFNDHTNIDAALLLMVSVDPLIGNLIDNWAASNGHDINPLLGGGVSTTFQARLFSAAVILIAGTDGVAWNGGYATNGGTEVVDGDGRITLFESWEYVNQLNSDMVHAGVDGVNVTLSGTTDWITFIATAK